MVQDAISRMSANSMSLKTMAVTVVGAIIALAAAQGPIQDGTQSSGQVSTIILTSLVPVALFWLLDAYYLGIEKAYRKLFDEVRRDSSVEPFSMDFRPYWGGFTGTLKIAVSTAVMTAYPVVMGLVLLIWLGVKHG
jgi:hypothetical protein